MYCLDNNNFDSYSLKISVKIFIGDKNKDRSLKLRSDLVFM